MYVGQDSFATGQLSRRMRGRVSSSAYATGCRKLENAIVTRSGSVRMRPGLQHLGDVRNGAPCRLVPFVTKSGPHMVELTAGWLRVWDAEARSVVSLGSGNEEATPYSEADLWNLQYTQSSDTLYLVHENHVPRALKLDGSTWTFDELDGAPALDLETKDVLLTVPGQDPVPPNDYDVTTGPEGSEVPYFKPGDVGTYFRIGRNSQRSTDSLGDPLEGQGGWMRVKAFETSETVEAAYLDVPPVFAGGSFSDWHGPFVARSSVESGVLVNANGDPKGDTAFGPGDIVRLSAQTSGGSAVNDFWKPEWMGNLVDINSADPHRFVFQLRKILPGTNGSQCHAMCFRVDGGSVGAFTGVGGVTVYDAAERDTSNIHIQPSGVDGTITLYSNSPIFSAGDVGVAFTLNDGDCTVTSYVGPHEVVAEVDNVLQAYYATTLWSRGWNATSGFPRACGIHQDRLFLGGIKSNPATIYGSKVDGHTNFALGPNDDDAVAFTFTAGRGERIAWISSAVDFTERGGALLGVGTDQNEWVVQGYPLTPSSVSVHKLASHGATLVQPAQVESSLFFVSRPGRSIRDMRFVEQQQGFNDVTVLADDMFESSPVREMAWARDPLCVLVCVREDESLRALSYRPMEGVFAWSPWPGVTAHSVASVSVNGRDELWAAVRRQSNVTTIEVFDQSHHSDGVRTASVSAQSITASQFASQRIWAFDGELLLGPFDVPAGGSVNIGHGPVSGSVTVGRAIDFRFQPLFTDGEDRKGSTIGRYKDLDRAMFLFAAYNPAGTVQDFDLVEEHDDSGWYVMGAGGFPLSTQPELTFAYDRPYELEMLGVNFWVEMGDV